MLVKDFMTRHPIMISPDMPASEAERLMAENNIRHLPVVESGKRLVGLITRNRLSLNADVLNSLNVWEITRYISNLKIRDLMVKKRAVVTITADRSVERAAATMTENHIGCLPVVDDDNVVIGIVTEFDLARSLQEMLGLPAEGIRVTMRMPNRPGEFVKLIRALADRGWGVMGIGTFPTRKDPDHYDAVVKIPAVTLEEVESELSKIPDQRIVDIRAVV
jgi:acetoin utilization protein AcuB